MRLTASSPSAHSRTSSSSSARGVYGTLKDSARSSSTLLRSTVRNAPEESGVGLRTTTTYSPNGPMASKSPCENGLSSRNPPSPIDTGTSNVRSRTSRVASEAPPVRESSPITRWASTSAFGASTAHLNARMLWSAKTARGRGGGSGNRVRPPSRRTDLVETRPGVCVVQVNPRPPGIDDPQRVRPQQTHAPRSKQLTGPLTLPPDATAASTVRPECEHAVRPHVKDVKRAIRARNQLFDPSEGHTVRQHQCGHMNQRVPPRLRRERPSDGDRRPHQQYTGYAETPPSGNCNPGIEDHGIPPGRPTT